jgi:hypothetical protein
MFDKMKPGHILRFEDTCPSTIHSPGAGNAASNNNTLATAWTTTSNLGLVKCLSHPSGDIAAIAAVVATRLRTKPDSIAQKASRAASYSAPGRVVTPSDRAVGQGLNCDFVGYVEGQSNYIQSALTVFSKDFSGCLMVAYTVGRQRCVAHVAASQNAKKDCKQAFLTARENEGAALIGWFRPYVDATDFDRKKKAFSVIGKYVGNNINKLTTFGVVTQGGEAYSVDAFKPTGIGGNDWVVTDVSKKEMSQSWSVL